LNITL